MQKIESIGSKIIEMEVNDIGWTNISIPEKISLKYCENRSVSKMNDYYCFLEEVLIFDFKRA